MSLSNFQQRKELIIELGKQLKTLRHESVYQAVRSENPWFIPASINLALQAWEKVLTQDQVENWLANYSNINNPSQPLDILIVMAGNLPLVGLHDLLSSVISGHRTWIKMSTKDQVLLKLILNQLAKQFTDIHDWIIPISKLPTSPAAIIASGSNESKAYFHKLYQHTPSILRGHRTSVAVLDGKESDDQLMALRQDILAYHGLGCRNVTHILAPSIQLIEQVTKLHQSMPQYPVYEGYGNNLKQQQIIARMNNRNHYHAGQYLLFESTTINSPMSVVHYQIYEHEKNINQFLTANKDQIQCCISNLGFDEFNPIPFGQAQFPALDDYADQVDTLNFLQSI